MNASFLTTTTAALAISVAGTASAAIDVHVTGTSFGGWGVWVTGLFASTPNPDGSTHHAYADTGSGNPMDFMMTLSDGTSLDGAGLDMRMITADTVGTVGDAEIELTSWSWWGGYGGFSLHVIWDSAGAPITLQNIGSSGKDGVNYQATSIGRTLDWTLDRGDGTVETFTTDFDTFDITLPVPAPGAAALFGVAGLTATRRRRGS